MIPFSGATVLVLITMGFALAGIVGAIVALPVAAIVRDLFAYFFKKSVAASLVAEGEVVAPAAEPTPVAQEAAPPSAEAEAAAG
jgi:hypothetical protein